MIFNTTSSTAKRRCFHRNDLCNLFQDINFEYVYLSADCGDKLENGKIYILMGKFKCILFVFVRSYVFLKCISISSQEYCFTNIC